MYQPTADVMSREIIQKPYHYLSRCNRLHHENIEKNHIRYNDLIRAKWQSRYIQENTDKTHGYYDRRHGKILFAPD